MLAESTSIYSVTVDPLVEKTIEEILKQRSEECFDFISKSTPKYEPGTFCSGQFDSWSCFPDTPINSTAKVSCPPIFEFDTSRFAYKVCESDANWFRHPETNRTWTNYTNCINFDDVELRNRVNLIYISGYSISLIAILLSIFIFFRFSRSLKCAQITLHKNLFASFAASNLLWLIFNDAIVLKGKDQYSCIALHLILHYFLLTNYAFMLCQGFHLHIVIVYSFTSEQKLMKWLIALGWSVPALVLILYGTWMGFMSGDFDRESCWMNESPFTNLLIVPICFSLLLNLLLLCNIARVVWFRGPTTMPNGPSREILHVFRATLSLVLLLGLQYILSPFRPVKKHPYEKTYEIIIAIISSFQGLCVATLYCFCNGEVVKQVKSRLRNLFYKSTDRGDCEIETEENSQFLGRESKTSPTSREC